MPSDLPQLVELALRGLPQMFDEQKQLFCHRLVRTSQGFVREGYSPRYTIMTLLGLQQVELSGGTSPIDIQSLYQSFVANTEWINSVGDLGLLVWLTAAFAPEQLENLRRKHYLEEALHRHPDARAGRTMELAWFLTGLSYAAEADTKLTSRFTDLAQETYKLLLENQGERGYFGHLNTKKSLVGRLRGRIGSFADQIYPILAFSKFSKVFRAEEALAPARKCASAICQAQGELGQWWWLYDSQKGNVSSHFPVYSVHQHAMAPMGLFALEEATGESYQAAIYKGLRWIYGNNELGVDMRDCEGNVIWRCIRPENKRSKYAQTALSLLLPARQEAPAEKLEVLYEDWPYELGWLLFAFARKAASEPEVFSYAAPVNA